MNRTAVEQVDKFEESHHSHSYHFFCNNCGKYGNHSYNNCKFPVTSIGLIAVRRSCYSDAQSETNYNYEFLMIRRKDTLGFVDFIRGKYTFTNYIHVKNIIDEMTLSEKNRLLNCDFKQLWTEMWGSYTNYQFTSEEMQSRDKFNKLKSGVFFKGSTTCVTLRELIERSPTRWKNAEWGFPKGRRNNQEYDIDCALRENLEETGYPIKKNDILSNIAPFEEVFIGSNLKSYKHKYFVSFISNDLQPITSFEKSEVSKLKWLSFEQCVKKIRPYNTEKIKMLNRIYTLLTTACVVKHKT